MKRKLYMVPVLLMLGIFLTICPAYADDTIRVYVDKTEIQFDVAPQLYDNRTMVPVRSIFKSEAKPSESVSQSPAVSTSLSSAPIR